MSTERDAIWAIDMDRTLLDTDATFDKFAEVCAAESSININSLYDAKKATQDSGGAFDVMGHLEKQGVGAAAMDELYQTFAAQEDGESLLYPDALPFLAQLPASSLIVTFGAEKWQSAKLEATGLSDFPHLITPMKHKGELIKSWQSDSKYAVAARCGELFVASSVVLVDDKAPSFKGLPDDCTGYLLERNGEILESQKGEIPEQVIRVHGLAEITV